ncbi:MAG: RNA polymerase sigma factor [Planctomycetota bacterium]
MAEAARVRLREYVFRLTLQEDLTQDIVQESILEMFRVFKKLKRADRFWAWLRGIAFNKLRSHYGRQWRHKTTSLSEIEVEVPARDSHNALAGMVNRELKQVVIRSMQKLAPRHRAVLTLRCYEQMPYSKIAELMGCTEFGAQALFYRAKKSLTKELSRHGLGKGYLLAALVLFGKMTATTEAAAAKVSITAASIKVGAAASLAAMVTSKTAVISLATAGVIAGGSVVTRLGPHNGEGLRERGTNAILNTPGRSQTSAGTEQCWYFFPEGPERPMMARLLTPNASGKRSYCRRLQNQHANYYYDKGTVYLVNSRMYNPDLSVWILPTDSERLSGFIAGIEGRQADMECVSAGNKGLLIISERSGDQGNKIWRTDWHFNVLEEEYFQFDWPASARIVDNRDAMHKRGWTYFRISGRINGEKVSGTGRIPFVYEALKQYGPWLKLQLANGSTIVDNGLQACVFDASGKATARFRAGSFFKGLGRPWMGLHTIDTVRRDAAEKQMPFETEYAPGDETAEVLLTCEAGTFVYTVDMETDVVEKIIVTRKDGGRAELIFSYLQDIGNLGNQFTLPGTRNNRQMQQESAGILWLAALADHGR